MQPDMISDNTQPTQKAPRRSKKRIILLAVLAFCAAILLYLFLGWPIDHKGTRYGITWSKTYAEQLGLNSDQGLEYMFREVGVRDVRLPAYWQLVEPTEGTYDFSWLDKELDLAHQYGATVTLAVGARLPRWPECWAPDWALQLSPEERKAAQLDYVREVYRRYADDPALERWQIENEVSFTFFAKCEGLTDDIVREEMRLVRGLEQSRPPDKRRPVTTTDSGELSTWLAFTGDIDGKGISIYRVVTNPLIGIIRYWFVPPWFYARKAALARPFVGPFHVSEFQMEPWADAPIETLSDEAQFQVFGLPHMKKALTYAKQTGFNEIYFWGAEWWLWMKEARGHSEFIDTMKRFFTEAR